MPDAGSRAIWDAINLILLSWTTFEIPVNMLFEEAGGESAPGLSCDWNTFMIINFTVDILFLVDVVVSFNTAYFDDNSILVDDRLQIALNYMKSWFVLDVGTSVPLDQIICALGIDGAIDGQIVRSIKIVRLLKLARILKFMRILKKWERISGSKTVRTASRMGKFIFLMIFVTHISGCIWMIPVVHGNCAPGSVENAEGTCTNWLKQYAPHLNQPDSHWSSKYGIAIYFSVVTLSTVGFGDVTPTNDLERIVASFLALCGAVIFAYCIGSISTLANEENATEAAIDESLRSLHDFLQLCNLPMETQQHVKQHLLFTAKTAPHIIHSCLGLIPRRLRYKIIDDCLKDHLTRSPIFQTMDSECRSFIAQYLYPQFLPANTFLFRALEVGMEMYWITKGEVEVLNVSETRTLTKLRAGDFVGEISLFPDLVSYRTSSVRAIADTNVFELRRQDLENSIKPYLPDVYQAIKEIATVRFKWLDTEPLFEAMAARVTRRCKTMHNEARGYEEQRLAILKKAVSEGAVPSQLDPQQLDALLNPITTSKPDIFSSFKARAQLESISEGKKGFQISETSSNTSQPNSNESGYTDNGGAFLLSKSSEIHFKPEGFREKSSDQPGSTTSRDCITGQGLPPVLPIIAAEPHQSMIQDLAGTVSRSGLATLPPISLTKRTPPPPLLPVSPRAGSGHAHASHPVSQPGPAPRLQSPSRNYDESYPHSPRNGLSVSPDRVGDSDIMVHVERQTRLQKQMLLQIQALASEMHQISSQVQNVSAAVRGLDEDVRVLKENAGDSLGAMKELKAIVQVTLHVLRG